MRNLDHLHSILLEFIHGHEPLLLGKSHQGDDLLESGNFLDHPGQLDPISHGLGFVLVSIELDVDPQDLGIMQTFGVEEHGLHFSVSQHDTNSVHVVWFRPLITSLSLTFLLSVHEARLLLDQGRRFLETKALFDVSSIFIFVVFKRLRVYREVSLKMTLEAHTGEFVQRMSLVRVVGDRRVDRRQVLDVLLVLHLRITLERNRHWCTLFLQTLFVIFAGLDESLEKVSSIIFDSLIRTVEPPLTNLLAVDLAILKSFRMN